MKKLFGITLLVILTSLICAATFSAGAVSGEYTYVYVNTNNIEAIKGSGFLNSDSVSPTKPAGSTFYRAVENSFLSISETVVMIMSCKVTDMNSAFVFEINDYLFKYRFSLLSSQRFIVIYGVEGCVEGCGYIGCLKMRGGYNVQRFFSCILKYRL